MPTSKQGRHLVVSGTLDRLRERVGRSLESDSDLRSWTEAEREALLRVTPGRVFRLKLQPDGSVSATGDCGRFEIPASSADSVAGGPEPDQLARSLCQELAREFRGLLEEFLQNGEVHHLRLEVGQSGEKRRYDVRVTASAPGEIVALVREASAQRESGTSASRSEDELDCLNEILQDAASLQAGDEEVIRDVSTKLNALLEDTIEAIQSIVQKKDPTTARHQARVWKLACAIGREMDLGKTRVTIIGLAALVHDFGKVFIPPSILNKPGKLTEEEYSAVKNHAEAVFQILSTIDLFCPIADIVHQHHERINGSGYPLGLKGDDILLEARIIAVADVVEAMLSDRPHRPALGVEAAMKEIGAGKGTLYDANAVEACIRLFTSGKFEFDAETDSATIAAPGGS